MKKFAMGLAAALLIGGVLSAQGPARLFTKPPVPTADALERLNLKLAWRSVLPLDGHQDGIASVQIPDRFQPAGALILVQTRAAMIMAVDARPGRCFGAPGSGHRTP